MNADAPPTFRTGYVKDAAAAPPAASATSASASSVTASCNSASFVKIRTSLPSPNALYNVATSSMLAHSWYFWLLFGVVISSSSSSFSSLIVMGCNWEMIETPRLWVMIGCPVLFDWSAPSVLMMVSLASRIATMVAMIVRRPNRIVVPPSNH